MAPAKPAQRSKKYRDKIKKDPEKYQQYLEREKERYKKRKETGKLKAISQLSKREQRCRRRQWKVNQRNKRASDENREKIQSYIAGNTPPISPIGQEEHVNDVPILEASPDISDSSHHETPSRKRGRKIVRAVTNIIAHIATSCNIFTSSIRNMNKTLITLRTSPFKMAALGGGRLILANQDSLYHASWRPRLPNVFESGGGQNRQKARGAPWDRTADGLSPRV